MRMFSKHCFIFWKLLQTSSLMNLKLIGFIKTGLKTVLPLKWAHKHLALCRNSCIFVNTMIDVLRRLFHFGKCIIKYLMQGTALCIESTNRIWKTVFVHTECFSKFSTKVYSFEIFLTTIFCLLKRKKCMTIFFFVGKHAMQPYNTKPRFSSREPKTGVKVTY